MLNPQTGNVSPQFHCLYDDAFTTWKTDAKFSSLRKFKAKVKHASLSILDLLDGGWILPSTYTAPPPSIYLPQAFVDTWDTVDNMSSIGNNIVISTSLTLLPRPIANPVLPPAPLPDPTILPPNQLNRTCFGHTVKLVLRFGDQTHPLLLVYNATFSPATSDDVHLL